MPTALIAGLDPALLTDDTDEVTSTRVRAAMDVAVAELRAEGVHAELCLLPEPGPGAVIALRGALERRSFDVVVIGAGVRLEPALSWLLEELVEVVAGCHPRPRTAFNGHPEGMAEAVRRVLGSAARVSPDAGPSSGAG